ncbi:hypothetical protein MTP03_06460 [Tsukamurella sp. PLM1]|nr:DUF6886 family protein [Tsukamurella sp. PLM1]BDH55707.1 hypothetical protein MTP03_06460 [Tsukamurella sp. PLM1]
MVWAVDERHAPDYWFPRQCPRAMAWRTDASSDADVAALLTGADRVHMIEYGWLEAFLTAEVYAYRFDAEQFTPFGDDGHAMVATVEVVPLGPPEPVGALAALHDAARIELRVVPSLEPWWDRVVTSSLGWSGIRLRNRRHGA